IFELHTWIYQQVLFDVQVNFSYNGQVAFLQQVIVWQNTSRKRVLNGHYTPVTYIFISCNFYHLTKSSTADSFHTVSKELPGGNLVKTTLKPLYGYFFIHYGTIKIPAGW